VAYQGKISVAIEAIKVHLEGVLEPVRLKHQNVPQPEFPADLSPRSAFFVLELPDTTFVPGTSRRRTRLTENSSLLIRVALARGDAKQHADYVRALQLEEQIKLRMAESPVSCYTVYDGASRRVGSGSVAFDLIELRYRLTTQQLLGGS